MKLAAMEMFVRAAEARSLSDAARKLGVSKSVVSKQITQMEHALGVCLLHRTTRSVTLTEIGSAFYERCARMIAAAEEAESVATHFQSAPRGVLKLHAPVDFGVRHLTPALPKLLARYPELRVDVTFNDQPANLAEEGFDVAIVIEPEPNGGLVARRLAPIHRNVCASPEYFRRHGTPHTPHQLAQHNCLVFAPRGTEREWCFGGAGGETRVTVDGSVRLNNQNAIREAALAGLGVALLPTYLIGADLQGGALQSVLDAHPATEVSIWAVYLRNRHLSTKTRAFIDFFFERFSPHPPWDAAELTSDGPSP
ncbi:MAG: LysR family transcriptional regulator [Casimicrobiaceae bacterium]